jgi:hypothetical protein
MERVFDVLEAFLAPWIFELLPGAPRYFPLVEIAEYEDREIYQEAPIPVRVSQTGAGQYLIALAGPLACPSQMEATVVEDRVMLKLPNCRPNEIASKDWFYRTYSFALPKNCDASTLEARVDGGFLTMVARRIGKRISDVSSRRQPCHAPSG